MTNEEEVDAQRAAELRGLVGHPGWRVAMEVLEERKLILSRAIMTPADTRPSGLSDERIRGEFLILSLLLDNPLRLLESYDTLVSEMRTREGEEPPIWAQAAEQLGMRNAGFPEPTSEEE